MTNDIFTNHVLTPDSVGDIFSHISKVLPDPDKILRDKGYNYSFFRELLKEPFFDGVWEKRIGNIVRNNYFFIPPDESAVNKEIVAYFENWIDNQNLHTLYSGLLDAVLYGYSPNEIVYTLDKIGKKDIWGIKEVSQKPQEWIGFDDNGIAMRKNGFCDYTNLEDYKYIITRHYNTYTNPYGKKLASILFWMLVFKKGGWRFFTIFIEKFGGASAFSEIPEIKYEDINFKEQVLIALDSLASGGVGAFPEGCKTQLIESKDKGGSAELYKTYIDMIDKNIAICILGEVLSTTQNETGAKAAAQVHNEVRKEKSDIDMSIIEPAINELIKNYAILNYGVTNNLPIFIFEREAELNVQLAERDKLLVDVYNVEFTEDYVAEQYNIDKKFFKIKVVETPVKDPLQGFKSVFADDSETLHKEDKQLIKEDNLISEFAKKQSMNFQSSVDAIVDEMIDCIDDISDTDAIFSSIMNKYPTLNFDDIVSVINNVRFAASQIGAYSENPNAKKKSSLSRLFSVLRKRQMKS